MGIFHRHRTNGGVEPLEIVLANGGDLVLRGFTGDELEPAVLVGEVILNLSESTNLKELQLIFSGNANVTWRDTTNHHCDHALFYHDFSFLNPSSSTDAHSHSISKPHSHTLPAGRHVFPFSLHIPGSLPASLRTYSGTCVIEYKLKAVAVRTGLATDWKLKKVIRISRGFGADAVEYNQTLEIENTWPGKVMYAFTIPHKAYAAGEKIPVSVKFSPLAKGVRIVTLATSIREHTTIHSKSNTSFSEVRDAAVVKYHFVPEAGTNAVGVVPQPRSAAASFSNGEQATASARASGSGSGPIPASADGFSSQSVGLVDDGTDTEVDIVLDIPIPIWTAPTHVVFPVFINHKIKWSAFIRNPDGHVSELRCALPIHILAPCLAEEARLASAGSRTLLFGESGVLAHSDVPQVDLPSYQDHIRDRVANAETASNFSVGAAFISTPWSSFSTPFGTPTGGSPMTSPSASRPSSPPPGGRQSSTSLHPLGGQQPTRSSNFSPLQHSVASGSGSGALTPVSPAGVDPEHPEDHRNWIDSELMSTLNLDHTSPPGSNPSSRPGSRPPSRPASPDHSASNNSLGSLATSEYTASRPSSVTRGSSTSTGFFSHIHLPKPLRPLTSFSRMGSTTSIQQIPSSSNNSSPPLSSHSSNHPSPSALSSALAAHAARSGPGYPVRPSILDVHTHQSMSNSPGLGGGNGSAPHSVTTSPMSTSPGGTHSPSFQPFTSSPGNGTTSPAHYGARTPEQVLEGGQEREVDFLSQVPSYDVAARGFLGGGVTPISMALPNYEDLNGERS